MLRFGGYRKIPLFLNMKKKIFIIFGAILILISAFQNKIFAYNPVIDGAREYMSDMFEDSLNNGEISLECYEELKKQAGEELSKAEMTDKLKENLFFFAVGQYANISEDVAAQTLLNLSDIWKYIFWDKDTQSFGFDDGVGEYIKNGLDTLIYDEPSTVVKRGNWYKVTSSGIPIIIPAYSSSILTYTCNGDGWVCVASGKTYIASFNSPASFTIVQWNSVDTTNLTYHGSVSSGYYKQMGSPASLINGETPVAYSSYQLALADLFGEEWSEPSDEPILNGKGIIVNENPVFPSLSPIGALNPNYKTIVINNYNNGYPYPPNRGLDVNYYDYDYNYNVPFWEGYELETIAYPEELDFPSVEFETVEVDSNIDSAIEGLSGWIIEFLLFSILLLVLGLII